MAIESITTLQSVTGKEIPVYDANYDNSQMDQEDFLKVLLANFQYQDPFETQDIAEFIDNTVKLRELEVMNKFEDSIQQLSGSDTLFLNATNLIDKMVLYKGENLTVENGKGYVEFVPKENANSAVVYIYDQEGNVVAQESFVDVQAGKRYTYDLSDEGIVDGDYRVSVVIESGEERVQSDIFAMAKVDGIQKDDDSIKALIADQEIELSDIIKVGG